MNWCLDQGMTLPRVLRLFASKTLVFTCFVAGILLQLVLATLLAIVLPQKIAIVVPLIAPFVIGSISYFIFGWITHRRTVRHEAERWLASGGRRASPQERASLRTTRLLLFVPALLVGALALFLPESIGIVSHFFYSSPAKLLGYEVRLPLTWIITEDGITDNRERSYASALECRGPLWAGFASYSHREPPAAGMSFWATASGDHAVRRTSSERIISVRTVLAGSESVTCREYVPVYEHIRENPNLRIIHCNTTDARFSASFVGAMLLLQSSMPRCRASKK